jgi:uroporphyrinogen-III decarboxylase
MQDPIQAPGALLVSGYDLERHNAEVERLWNDYALGRPSRVPVVLGASTRFFLLSSASNPEGLSFRQYHGDPDTMLQAQVRFSDWSRHNVLQDAPLGLPADGWDVRVDFQNYYEAAWLGCPIEYVDGEVPDTTPAYADDALKREVFAVRPGPWSGIMARNLEYYQHMLRRRAEGFEYRGRPIRSVSLNALGTDGPFTVACNVRGATEICLDLYVDPGYARELLDFITEAIIARIRAYREFLGEPVVRPSFGWADDSIQNLSTEQYAEFVLPCHRKLVAAFADPAAPAYEPAGATGLAKAGQTIRHNSIHLCGDASRHFPLIQRELNVQSFDTGYPIDFGAVRRAIGPGAQMMGGPTVELLLHGSTDAIREEARRILQDTGVTEGRRFILREANNLAPGTPLESLRAMHEAAKEFGRYES